MVFCHLWLHESTPQVLQLHRPTEPTAAIPSTSFSHPHLLQLGSFLAFCQEGLKEWILMSIFLKILCKFRTTMLNYFRWGSGLSQRFLEFHCPKQNHFAGCYMGLASFPPVSHIQSCSGILEFAYYLSVLWWLGVRTLLPAVPVGLRGDPQPVECSPPFPPVGCFVGCAGRTWDHVLD